ncbi:MAG TPA: S9 family peptidase [Chloroflexota bacterium]|nr:S9 family peptidase [Chloroflexota bacterium]
MAVAYVTKRADKDSDDYISNIRLWEGGRCRNLTYSGKDSAPRWAPDGSKLAFLSSRAGKPQIYILHRRGGEATQLTSRDLGAGEPVWSPDSSRIAFSASTRFPLQDANESGDEDRGFRASRIADRAVYKSDGKGFINSTRTHIFVVDTQGHADQLTSGDWNDDSPTWSPDGTHVAFASNRRGDWDRNRGSDIWTVPVSGGEPLKLTRQRGVWGSPVFSPDGREIAYSGYPIPEDEEEKPTYYHQLWVCDRHGDNPRNLLAGIDIEVGRSVLSDWGAFAGPEIRWVGSGLYFAASVQAATLIFRVTRKGAERVAPGEHDITSFDVADDGSLVYTKSDFTHPAELYRRIRRREERLTEENDPILKEIDLPKPERVAATSADGQEVEGWVLEPNPSSPKETHPLLLYIHGGPASAYGHTFFHELQWWSAQGFAVAFCNPRGGTSYGMEFKEAIRADWGNLDFQDLMAFVDEVVRFPWIDSNRVVAAGGSYGGFMVNWLAGHTDRFAAFCTQRSICNMVSQGGTSDIAAFREERLGGTPECNPEKLWDQSPLKYAANVKTPTLILHQEQDHRCPIEQGEQWFAALKRLGVPARFIRFPEESHGMSRAGKPSRRHLRLGYMRDWFRTYV